MNKSAIKAMAIGVGAAALSLSTAVFAQVSNPAPAPVVRVEKVIPLAEAFPNVKAGHNYDFRARQLVLAPGARTEQISHAGKPSITYVTKGVVREVRVGVAEPIVHQVGAATMDRGTVTHSWENAGTSEAVLLVVEVAPRTAQ